MCNTYTCKYRKLCYSDRNVFIELCHRQLTSGFVLSFTPAH